MHQCAWKPEKRIEQQRRGYMRKLRNGWSAHINQATSKFDQGALTAAAHKGAGETFSDFQCLLGIIHELDDPDVDVDIFSG